MLPSHVEQSKEKLERLNKNIGINTISVSTSTSKLKKKDRSNKKLKSSASRTAYQQPDVAEDLVVIDHLSQESVPVPLTGSSATKDKDDSSWLQAVAPRPTMTEKRLHALNQIVDESLLKSKIRQKRKHQKKAFDGFLQSMHHE